jgi:hypothetical protein
LRRRIRTRLESTDTCAPASQRQTKPIPTASLDVHLCTHLLTSPHDDATPKRTVRGVRRRGCPPRATTHIPSSQPRQTRKDNAWSGRRAQIVSTCGTAAHKEAAQQQQRTVGLHDEAVRSETCKCVGLRTSDLHILALLGNETSARRRAHPTTRHAVRENIHTNTHTPTRQTHTPQHTSHTPSQFDSIHCPHTTHSHTGHARTHTHTQDNDNHNNKTTTRRQRQRGTHACKRTRVHSNMHHLQTATHRRLAYTLHACPVGMRMLYMCVHVVAWQHRPSLRRAGAATPVDVVGRAVMGGRTASLRAAGVSKARGQHDVCAA